MSKKHTIESNVSKPGNNTKAGVEISIFLSILSAREHKNTATF
jgi:hypothetical protein